MTTTAPLLQTAMSLYEAGDYEAASQAYVRVLQQDSQNAEAWHRLGTLMFQAGGLDVALDSLTNAIRFGGPSAERYYHLGLVYRARNECEQAEAALRQSLQLDAGNIRATNNLGIVLLERNRLDEAGDQFRRVLTIEPGDTTARTNLGNVLKEQGLHVEALVEYRAVLAVNPECIDTLNNLANLFFQMGRYQDAMTMCHCILDAKPGLGGVRNRLLEALSYHALNAIVEFRADLEKDDRDAGAWQGLGEALQCTGESEPAARAFRRVVEIDPHHKSAHSNLIYCSQFVHGVTAQRMSELYSEWDRCHSQPLQSERPALNNDPNPDRRLRLGVLSPNLWSHSAAVLTVLGFENIDRSQFEICFYSDRRHEDDVTDRFKAVADHWHVVSGMSDTEITAAIHDDGIDVLIVMAGHQVDNRQRVAARKPAPVQIAWTGDPAGHSAVDWLIADRFLIPEEFEEFYPESILRMPHDYVTFYPPSFAPDVSPSPCTSNGHVTFGSFNQAVKYHAALLENWAGIMQRVPNSRLLLVGKSTSFSSDRILRPFQSAGIEDDRVELHEMIGRRELLASYNRIDVCLDTYPFSGGLTTLEALWMGVPVVTLPGETFAGRTSLSHLSNVGLGNLIAATPEDYADVAVNLAQDPERLLHLRQNLRDDLRASVICNGPQFGRDLTAALRTAWRKWAEQQSPAN